MYQGKIIVTPREANLYEDKDILGKGDPYIIFKLGSSEQKTSVASGAGKHPSWNQVIRFKF